MSINNHKVSYSFESDLSDLNLLVSIDFWIFVNGIEILSNFDNQNYVVSLEILMLFFRIYL